MEFGGGATARNDFLRDSQHQHYSREKPEPMMNWKPTPAEDAGYASCSSTASSSYASLMVRSKPPPVTATTSSSQQRVPPLSRRLRRSLSAGRRLGQYVEMDSNLIVEQPPPNKTYYRYAQRDGSFSSEISTGLSDFSLRQGDRPSKSCFAALVGNTFQNCGCCKQQPTESEKPSLVNQKPDPTHPPQEQKRFGPEGDQQPSEKEQQIQRKLMEEEESSVPLYDELLFSSKHLEHIQSTIRSERAQKLAEQEELAKIQQRAIEEEQEEERHIVQLIHHSHKPKSCCSSTPQPSRSEQPQLKDIVFPDIPISREEMVRQPQDISIHTSGSSNQPIPEPLVPRFFLGSTKEDQAMDMNELKQCQSQDDSITPFFQLSQKHKGHSIISLQQMHNMEGPLDPRQVLVGTPQASRVSSFKIMAEQPLFNTDSEIKHRKTLKKKKKKKKNHVEIDLASLSEVVKSHGSLGDQDVDEDTNSESAQVMEAEQPPPTTTTRDKKEKISHYFVDGYEGDCDTNSGTSPDTLEKLPEMAPPSVPAQHRTVKRDSHDIAAVPKASQQVPLPLCVPHRGQMIIVVPEEGDQSTISSMSFGSLDA